MTVSALIFGALSIDAVLAPQANSQSSGGQYRIDPVAIPAGGGPVAGGNYQITSTLGQSTTAVLTGTNYTVFGGFWSPVGGIPGDFIFADSFDSNP
jgi:hypothetical protein